MSSRSFTADRNAGIAFFICTFAVGVLALAAGLILNYERKAMYGIATGCLPTGALGAGLTVWLSRWMAKNRPDLIQRKANALDERKFQISHHAGYAAFWAAFTYIGLYTMLSTTQFVRSISHTAFGIATMYVFLIAYWAATFFYNRKY